jgi:WD40 repeat protein
MEIKNKVERISTTITDCGDLGLPIIKPFKTVRGMFLHFLSTLEHENSVDALSANPVSENEFATASHDKTIKIWDA